MTKTETTFHLCEKGWELYDRYIRLCDDIFTAERYDAWREYQDHRQECEECNDRRHVETSRPD